VRKLLPVSKSFLGSESIWKEPKYSVDAPLDLSWGNLIIEGNNFFDRNQHFFLQEVENLIIYNYVCFQAACHDIIHCVQNGFWIYLEEQKPILVHNN
jgi:hypothetical protein